jgi:hypothetical protein
MAVFFRLSKRRKASHQNSNNYPAAEMRLFSSPTNKE